jgi:hypothetical protein
MVAALFFVAALVEGQGARQALRSPAAAGPLVPEAARAELKLTTEQAEKLQALEKEYADKARDIEAKARELMEKARQDKDRAAYKQATELAEQGKTLRGSYEEKLVGLLNAEQKKSFEARKSDSAAPARAGLAGQGQLVPAALQERLNLSDDQKEKLRQIQTDFEAKSMQVLTEEQRRRVEELRTRARKK